MTNSGAYQLARSDDPLDHSQAGWVTSQPWKLQYRSLAILTFCLPCCFWAVSIPQNDRCVDATILVEGVPVTGDNTDANFDFINQGVCGPRSDRRAVWYEINGVGKNATVYVCTNNDKITDYGVFQQCNTQKCEGSPDQLAEAANCDDDEANTYTFFAENGESYYVHVRSDTLDPEGSNFTIWYTEPSDAPTMAPSDAGRTAFSVFSSVGTMVAICAGAYLTMA